MTTVNKTFMRNLSKTRIKGETKVLNATWQKNKIDLRDTTKNEYTSMTWYCPVPVCKYFSHKIIKR